jgi:hypothetical protein
VVSGLLLSEWPLVRTVQPFCTYAKYVATIGTSIFDSRRRFQKIKRESYTRSFLNLSEDIQPRANWGTQSNMPFLEAASECLRCSAKRVNLVEESSKFDLSAVKDGVVIFFAAWSGPAHVALKALTEQLRYLKQDIPVWVLNVDTLTVQVDEKFLGAKHGYGETFFFREGFQVGPLLRLHADFGESFRLKWQEVFSDQ